MSNKKLPENATKTEGVELARRVGVKFLLRRRCLT